MKHLALVLVIEHLKKKDAPFCVIDAHGGIGLYDLQSVQAGKTLEWQAGIGRFADIMQTAPEDFALYANTINSYLQDNHYPGSPMISMRGIRGQDRLIANELHPEDFEELSYNLRPYKNTFVSHLDAYESIRANIPPEEKRGVVLIDPPFEKTDEFQVLIRQMEQWKRRFATGIFMIWYPIKAHLAVDDLKEAAAKLGMPRTWCFETLAHPRDQEGTFNGSGLIIMNAPYMVPERLTALFPLLKERMGLYSIEQSWLTAP